LPQHSFFAEAVSLDDELAASMLDTPGAPPDERMSHWTPELAVLAAMFDRLGTVVAAVIGSAGGKPPDIAPYPRPVTAGQRARERSRRDDHDRLVMRLLPR